MKRFKEILYLWKERSPEQALNSLKELLQEIRVTAYRCRQLRNHYKRMGCASALKRLRRVRRRLRELEDIVATTIELLDKRKPLLEP